MAPQWYRCPSCGGAVGQGAAFCPSCGTRLAESTPGATQQSTPQPPPPPGWVAPAPPPGWVAPPPPYGPPVAVTQAPASRASTPTPALLAGIVIVAVVAGLAYFQLGPGAAKPSPSPVATPVATLPATSGATQIPTLTPRPSPTQRPTATGVAVLQRGQVVFSTTVVSGTTTNCRVDNQVTSISSGVAVYATYIFKSTQGSDPVSIDVTRDGQAFLSTVTLPTTDTNGSDCFADTTDLSQLPDWGPGSYHFSLTSGGSIVSQGDLVVLPLI